MLLFVVAGVSFGQTTTTITQFGITWTFSEAREYGQFANGDYWVQGPVTITSMTPDWNATTGRNGWMVNPAVNGGNGFSSGTPNYSSSLRPALPLTLTTGSVVKTIGIAGAITSSVQQAAVLTVLPDIPPDRGVNHFRPPYNGTSKPLYAVADLRDDLLPSFIPTANAPSLATVEANFSRGLRLDHFTRSRCVRPVTAFNNNTDGYQPQNTPYINEAMLRLMGNESFATKLPALIQFTQAAIDKAHAVYLGFRSASGDGHDPNHRIMAAWGAVMLDMTDVLAYMATASGFHEDTYLQQGVNAVLWGESNTEFNYWNYVMGNGGSRSNKDPYGFIDGGYSIYGAGEYQIITSQSLKGQALVGRLFPELQACFPAVRWTRLSEYAERWVTVGSWMSPDPVAPFDGIDANYGVTFGPNGSGSYIAGAGRQPSLHGSVRDGGQYKSLYVASMWTAYANLDEPADVTAPEFESAAINAVGTTLEVTFTENVMGVNAAHYAITGGPTISAPIVSGRVVSFTLTPAMTNDQVPTLSYTSGAGRTADNAGNLLASFSGAAVTNNSLETTPIPPRAGRKGRGNGGGAGVMRR